MPEFICRMGTVEGDVIERVYQADTADTLRRDLERKEFLIFSIRRKGGALGLLPAMGRGKIKVKEFLAFNQQLAALVQAGLPIVSSLDVLLERRKNPVFRKALTDIRDQVKAGTSLSEAFLSQGDLFPKIYSSSLASGERSGEVASVLQRYITHSRKMLILKGKVVAALMYPMILMFLSLGVVAILVYYVLPKFAAIYEGFGGTQSLPLVTKVLVSGSSFLQQHVVAVIVSLILAVFAFSAFRGTRAGAKWLDRRKLGLPFAGVVIKKYCVSQFTRTLGTLLSGGIPLVASLEISSPAVGNLIFHGQLTEVTRKVREGNALAQSLEETGLFDDLALEMIKVGESTGSLQDMLENVSQFYDEEIDEKLQTVEALLVPVMLVVMGVVIAGILLAIYLPLIKSYGAQGGV